MADCVLLIFKRNGLPARREGWASGARWAANDIVSSN